MLTGVWKATVAPLGAPPTPLWVALAHVRYWLQFPELSSSMMLCSALHLTWQWECRSLSVVQITRGDPLTESGKSPPCKEGLLRTGWTTPRRTFKTFCPENSRVQNGGPEMLIEIYWLPAAVTRVGNHLVYRDRHSLPLSGWENNIGKELGVLHMHICWGPGPL